MVDAKSPSESPNPYGSPSSEPTSKLARRQCGGRLDAFPVVFTTDSRYFFCSSFVDIKMFSVETGQPVRTLSSHTKLVTSAHINPKNPLQLISSSLDGTIKIWDFNDAVLLKTFDIKAPIKKMVISNSGVYIMARGNDGHRKHSKLYSYTLSGTAELRLLTSTWKCSNIAVSPSGELVAGVNGNKLIVYRLNTLKIEQQREYEHANQLVRLAFSPSGDYIATGDVRGIITQWLIAGDQLSGANPITTHKHWHAHEVLALTFNHEGTYMLSGGEEAVLVIWQMQSGNKQFLPRLATAITEITVSPDQSMYALCHRDGSVRLVSAITLKTIQVTNGLQYGEHDILAKTLGKNLVIEPRNGYAVLTGGVPGTIQFYNVKTDQRISEMEIVHQNVVSRTDDETQVFTHVEFVTFSSDGEWMASVDRRESTSKSPEELTLKFWKFDHSTQRYELNTRVESPHKKAVSALLFQPGKRGDVVVSLSFDGRFKIWTRAEISDQKGTEGNVSAWSCRATGFYRDYTPHDAVFSEDGSILAVAYGQVITLWSPQDNALKMTLCNSTPVLPILQLDFIPTTHFMVTYTQQYLLKIQCMAINKKQGTFVVCDTSVPKKSRLLFFSPETPIPFYVYTDLRAGCQSLCFLEDDNDGDLTGMLILNGKISLEYLAPRAAAKADTAAANPLGEGLSSNAYAEIFAKVGEQPQSEDVVDMVPSQRLIRPTQVSETLSAASHVLPPVTKLFEPFMEQLLVLSSNRSKQVPEDNSSDVESLSGEQDHSSPHDMEVDIVPQKLEPTKPSDSLDATDINFRLDFMIDFFKRDSIVDRATGEEQAKPQPADKEPEKKCLQKKHRQQEDDLPATPKAQDQGDKAKPRKEKKRTEDEADLLPNGVTTPVAAKKSNSDDLYPGSTSNNSVSKISKKSRTADLNGSEKKKSQQKNPKGDSSSAEAHAKKEDAVRQRKADKE